MGATDSKAAPMKRRFQIFTKVVTDLSCRLVGM